MPEARSMRAQRQLEALGVEVRTGSRVVAIDAHGVEAESAAYPSDSKAQRFRIDSACVIWAAGVAAAPLGRALAQACGAPCDRAGRVRVEPDLSLPGHADIAVIGDLAAAHSHAPGMPPRPVPGVSPAAKQMGRHAAGNIVRRLAGRPTRPFRYRDHGNLATIGRRSAVVDLSTPLGPLRFSGYLAWLFWLFAHVWFLIGFRSRLVVLLDWAWAYWTFDRHARVVAHPPNPSSNPSPDPTPDPGPAGAPGAARAQGSADQGGGAGPPAAGGGS